MRNHTSSQAFSVNSQSPQNLQLKIGVALLLMAVVYSAAQYFLASKDYNKGHEAYRRVDCTAATNYFDRVINGWRLVDIGGLAARAEQEKSECLAFKPALDQQQKGNLGKAVVAYNTFISSHKPDSYLVNAARDRAQSIVEKNKPEQLATREFCNNLKQFQPGLIPQRDTQLPPLYFACGETYTNLKNYDRASVMYESFLNEYPQHPLASQVKAGWAKTLVAQAKAQGAGKLPAPQRSGSTGGGSPVVMIRNDSPEPMRIVFSGPEGRIEELEACSTCQRYVGQPPQSCPNQGPVGKYTLKPGEYDVVVKSTGNRFVRPFKGTWTMNSGSNYSNCFYIVTNPGPVERQSDP
jgi:tetratricopeptide (TPR) repeat protein